MARKTCGSLSSNTRAPLSVTIGGAENLFAQAKLHVVELSVQLRNRETCL